MTPPAQQMQVFLAMALCGGALGAGYDALQWIRKCVLKRAEPGIFGGFFFGSLCAGGIIFTALTLRTDAFRWYTLLGAGMGMGIYAMTLGRILRAGRGWGMWICEKISRRGQKLTK